MSKNTPPPLTDPTELRAYSAEHLVYELQMFFGAVRAARTTSLGGTKVSSDFTTTTTQPVRLSGWISTNSEFRKNATIEAFAQHLRNLITFLYPDRYPLKEDDVAAHHFLAADEPWDAWLDARPDLPESLEETKRRADKELAHLTTQRIAGAPKEKAWPMADLAAEMVSLLEIFVKEADPSRLSTNVGKELERYESRLGDTR